MYDTCYIRKMEELEGTECNETTAMGSSVSTVAFYCQPLLTSASAACHCQWLATTPCVSLSPCLSEPYRCLFKLLLIYLSVLFSWETSMSDVHMLWTGSHVPTPLDTAFCTQTAFQHRVSIRSSRSSVVLDGASAYCPGGTHTSKVSP